MLRGPIHGEGRRATAALLDDVIRTGAQSGDRREALAEAGAETAAIVTLAVAGYRSRKG